MQNGKGERLNLVFLKPGINSQGAWDSGAATKDIKTQQPRGLYLLLSDDNIDKEWLDWVKGIDYLVSPGQLSITGHRDCGRLSCRPVSGMSAAVLMSLPGNGRQNQTL